MAGIKEMTSYPFRIKQEATQLFFEECQTKKKLQSKLGIEKDTSSRTGLRLSGRIDRDSSCLLMHSARKKAPAY